MEEGRWSDATGAELRHTLRLFEPDREFLWPLLGDTDFFALYHSARKIAGLLAVLSLEKYCCCSGCASCVGLSAMLMSNTHLAPPLPVAF
jgi:hypothetical protein